MYAELLEKLNIVSQKEDEYKTNCPYHGGHDSMFVNTAKGTFYCHACGEMGTLAKLGKKFGLKITTKKQEDEGEEVVHVRKYVPEDELSAACERLWADEGSDLRYYLATKRGITDGLVRSLGLGLGADHRLWIPVRDDLGCFNVRKYDWLKVSDKKVVNYAEGYGENVLLGDFSGDHLTMLEGEPDWLCAIGMGMPGPFTNTGGASNWKPVFTQELAGKTIDICLDNDNPGRKAAASRANQLRLAGCKVRIIEIPKKFGKDFTDFASRHGFEKEPIQELFGTAADQMQQVELGSSGQVYGQLAKIRAVVSGKVITPFLIPTKVEILCGYEPKGKLCKLCPAAAFEGRGSIELKDRHEIAIRCVDVPEDVMNRMLMQQCGIVRGCPSCQFTVTETREVQEVRLVNDLEDAEFSEGVFGEHVTRQAYSYIPLQTSGSYMVEALSTKHPKTQQALLLILSGTGSQSALETWTVEGKENILDFWRTN